jgi:acetyl esterase/lipase
MKPTPVTDAQGRIKVPVGGRRSLSLAGKRALFSMMLQTMPARRGTSVAKAWAGDVPVAWITPPSAKPGRLLYFLHGGGYTMGSIRSHIPLVSRLAAACGSRALLVDYRLAPEYPYPAGLEDSLTAYQWMRASADPLARIVLAGDSAGAGLAMSLMLSLRNGGEMPLACFLLSPWVDLAGINETPASGRQNRRSFAERNMHQMAELYASGEDLHNPSLSPIYGDLANLPPLLIHGGREEFLRRDAIRLATRAEQQGVDVTFEQYDGSAHCIHSFAPISGKADKWLHKAGDFLEQHLAGMHHV